MLAPFAPPREYTPPPQYSTASSQVPSDEMTDKDLNPEKAKLAAEINYEPPRYFFLAMLFGLATGYQVLINGLVENQIPKPESYKLIPIHVLWVSLSFFVLRNAALRTVKTAPSLILVWVLACAVAIGAELILYKAVLNPIFAQPGVAEAIEKTSKDTWHAGFLDGTMVNFLVVYMTGFWLVVFISTIILLVSSIILDKHSKESSQKDTEAREAADVNLEKMVEILQDDTNERPSDFVLVKPLWIFGAFHQLLIVVDVLFSDPQNGGLGPAFFIPVHIFTAGWVLAWLWALGYLVVFPKAPWLILLWAVVCAIAVGAEIVLYRVVLNPMFAIMPVPRDASTIGRFAFLNGKKVGFWVEYSTAVWLVIFITTIVFTTFLIMTPEKSADEDGEKDLEAGDDAPPQVSCHGSYTDTIANAPTVHEGLAASIEALRKPVFEPRLKELYQNFSESYSQLGIQEVYVFLKYQDKVDKSKMYYELKTVVDKEQWSSHISKLSLTELARLEDK